MNLICCKKLMRWTSLIAVVAMISALTGCDRDDDAKVYHVPKDASAPPPSEPAATQDVAAPAQPDMAPPAPADNSVPPLKYQVPAGWQEKPPGDMRVASFAAPGKNGQSADVSVIPLPVVGRDLELVNMWRSRVQLPPTTDPTAASQAKPVTIGSEQGRLFEFVSDKPLSGNSRQRLLVAMLTEPTMSWFFKITGDDETVNSQRDNFIQFLKSISFNDNAPVSLTPLPPTQPTQTDTANSDSIWTIPPGWQSTPPSQFLLAEYTVPGANGAKAEVNVAEMGGEGGGLLANVNRWRGQIGLAPTSDSDLAQLAQTFDTPGGKATLVDLTGTDAKTSAPTRLIAVIVAQNGQTWFYKLMGDKQIVAQQKDAFTKFIQSANYANAR
jgi:hypothetical protein